MATTSFLVRPQRCLKIVSWNINSVKTKIEKGHVDSFLRNYDVVCLNEIKTRLPVAFPGFVSFVSFDKENGNRGGTCVLVRDYLSRYLYDIDMSIADQVWFRLNCVPCVLFGACYVPPSDSSYFDYTQLSSIQEKVKSCKNGDECLVIGDLNARVGVAVRELPERVGLPQYSYTEISDLVQAPNDNAAAILGICVEERLLIVNNLRTTDAYFQGKKTFKRGREWISELDTCIVSEGLIKCIQSFNVVHNYSLPSDHAPIEVVLWPPRIPLEILMNRASELGAHGAEYAARGPSEALTKRSVRLQNMDRDLFLLKLNEEYEHLPTGDDVDVKALQFCEILYSCASASESNTRNEGFIVESDQRRWDRIIDENDQAKIWQAINWRGEISVGHESVDSKPGDDAFKAHFEQLFNPPDVDEFDLDELYTEVTIPVLDELIAPIEVETQIKKLKANKASGPDGIPPGVFRFLPAEWILFLTTFFNSLFSSASYPACWTTSKLCALFKRGSKADPGNYRGINILNSIAKIYDMVLSNRIGQWFKPYREQAGSQEGRGCTEHLVTLRILLDVARRKRLKLFIVFVDFSRAYDTVPRFNMFKILKRMGCGITMLMALVAMYRCTNSILGTALIVATVGVRQGSPTSCILFVLYVNDMIKLIKENCPLDGFLAWLHVMVMMDDTVLLSTTREGIQRKIEILCDFCTSHGMIVNTGKTKFMVINGSDEDKELINCRNNHVGYCNQYIYLGSPFSDDGSPSTAIKIHAANKMCHALKFISFVSRNNDVPFLVKKKVFDAALMSALIYGSESWLNGNIKPVEKLYKWCIKKLLGVRKTTANDLCMIELGVAPLRAIVRAKQRKFMNRMWTERIAMNDDPLMHAIRLTLGYDDAVSRYMRDLITNNTNDIDEARQELNLRILNSESNRLLFYKTVNPDLCVHEIYLKDIRVNEIERISWTRLRLSAHSLAIERGRWSRRGRGRLPLEERVCVCGQIQTEAHVIEDCPVTRLVRQRYNLSTVHELMVTRTDYKTVCTVVHELLSLF